MKKSSLWMSAVAAFGIAVTVAGCGKTEYFAGRVLPPSQLTNRVLIAVQNPSVLSKGALQIVDAYYDIRNSYNQKVGSFSIAGYSGALPVTIQNMPEEQAGAVYGSGDGSLTVIDYQKESAGGAQTGLNGVASSIFMTRNQNYIFAANQITHVLTVVDKTSGTSTPLSLPGVYRVSVNPGGSAALAFVQNSNAVYYTRKLQASERTQYAGGPANWPKAAVDCEPLNAPGWCLIQAQSPDNLDQYKIPYGAPLQFDRPVKAIFSADGGTAYILNCGPECGGTASSVSTLPVNPMIFLPGQQSGMLPTTGNIPTIPVPGGASNALLDGTTLYVLGQQPQPDGLFAGNLTVVNLASNTAGAPASVSDGAPGAMTRMILADDNTLWIGTTKCTNGERYAKGQAYGCLTMYNTSSNTVTTIEPYLGDLTGIASVTGLHKVYVAQGGQVHIYHTTDGAEMNNQFVTVTGTAYDVAYMDGISDGNNTVY